MGAQKKKLETCLCLKMHFMQLCSTCFLVSKIIIGEARQLKCYKVNAIINKTVVKTIKRSLLKNRGWWHREGQ